MELSEWISLGALIISIISALFARLSWTKSRAFYGLEYHVLRLDRDGKLHDDENKIFYKLANGDYSLQSAHKTNNSKIEVIIQKIKN